MDYVEDCVELQALIKYNPGNRQVISGQSANPGQWPQTRATLSGQGNEKLTLSSKKRLETSCCPQCFSTKKVTIVDKASCSAVSFGILFGKVFFKYLMMNDESGIICPSCTMVGSCTNIQDLVNCASESFNQFRLRADYKAE